MAFSKFIAAASVAALVLTGTSGLAALVDDRVAIGTALQQEVNDINAQLPALRAIIRDGSKTAAEREAAYAEFRTLNARKSSITYHLGAISTYDGVRLDRVIDLYGLNLNLDDDIDPDPVFNIEQALLQRIEETSQRADDLRALLRSGTLSEDDFEDTYNAYRAAGARVSSMRYHLSVIDGYSPERLELVAELYMLGDGVSVS